MTPWLVLVEEEPVRPRDTIPRRWLAAATSWQVISGGLKIAAVVGTVLNLLNQGGAILGDPASIDLVQGALNFLVPYLVSTYAASRQRVLDELARDDEDDEDDLMAAA